MDTQRNKSTRQRINDYRVEREILLVEGSGIGVIALGSFAVSKASDNVLEFLSDNPEQAHTLAEFSSANAKLMAVAALAAITWGVRRHRQIQELEDQQRSFKKFM
jgi:hypothetical protein